MQRLIMALPCPFAVCSLPLRGWCLIVSVAVLSVLASGAYNIQVFHSNAIPLAPGDEVSFINSVHVSDGSLTSSRCPVDIAAFVSRGAPSKYAAQQIAKIALRLEQLALVIPMFPVIMTPNVRHMIAAGTPFTTVAGAADALQCPEDDAVSRTFDVRALLLAEHNDMVQTLAESVPFKLRLICATDKFLSRACAGSAAQNDCTARSHTAACKVHAASDWSPPFTSVGM
jgi:hypothetical protein